MTLQDEFNAAALEYDRRIERDREAARLAALQHEAQRHTNDSLFAQALEEALTRDVVSFPLEVEGDATGMTGRTIKRTAPTS